MERIRLGFIQETLQSVLLELGDGRIEGKALSGVMIDVHEIVALITLMIEIQKDKGEHSINVSQDVGKGLLLIRDQVEICKVIQGDESVINCLSEVCIKESKLILSLKQSILELVIPYLSTLQTRAIAEDDSTVNSSNELIDQVNTACYNFIQEGHSMGLFIGIIQGDQIYSFGYGVMDKITCQRPDSSTIFQIGSITKVFTSLIAESLVEQGVIRWQDNISHYFPNSTITLEQLASHTSNLPRLPESWFPLLEENPSDPYSGLKLEHLEQFIRSYESSSFNKGVYCYSNLGAGLLGHILEWKTDQNYDSLLQQYVCSPFDMNQTSTMPKQGSTCATGYNELGARTSDWHFPILCGAGAVYSNGADMLRFLSANMDAKTGAFGRAKVKVVAIPGGAIGHGWHLDQVNGNAIGLGDIAWHNGGTGGFSSYIGFTTGARCGIVALANQANSQLDTLAIDLLKLAGKGMKPSSQFLRLFF